MQHLEPYCMKLSDFDSNFVTSVTELRNSKELFDVTLFSDEETPFQAHKLVLSASSSVFRNIFKFKQNSSPLLYIRGLTNKDLTNVLEFLYKGEVVLAYTDVETFLKVSRDLKLKGMFEENYELSKFDWMSEEELHTGKITDKKKSNLLRKENWKFDGNDVKRQKCDKQSSLKHINAALNKEDNVEMEENTLKVIRDNEVYENNVASQFESGLVNSKESEVDKKIRNMMFRKDSIWTCRTCGFTKNKKSNVQAHVEIKHVDNPQPCNFCENVSKNRPSLATHIRKNHSL